MVYVDGHCWRLLFPPTIDSQCGVHQLSSPPTIYYGPCFLHRRLHYPIVIIAFASNDVQHELERKSWNGVYRWLLLTTADVYLLESKRVTPIKMQSIYARFITVRFFLAVRCGSKQFWMILPSIKPQRTEALHKICSLHRSAGFCSQKTAPRFGVTLWKHVQISPDSRPSESANFIFSAFKLSQHFYFAAFD